MTAVVSGRWKKPWHEGRGRMARIVAMGDSTVAGDGLGEPEDIWIVKAVDLIAEELTSEVGEQPEVELVLFGDSGARLDDMKKLVAAAIESDPDLVVVTVGSNHGRPHRFQVGWPPVRFDLKGLRKDFEKFIEHFEQEWGRREKRGPAPRMLLTGVGDTSMVPYKFPGGPALSYLVRLWIRWVSWYVDRRIRKAVEDVTEKRIRKGREPKVRFLSTRGRVEDRLYAGVKWNFSADGFHPNAAGHEIWARYAAPHIKELIEDQLDEEAEYAARASD